MRWGVRACARGREWPGCPGCAKNTVFFGLVFVSLSCLNAASYVLLWPADIVRIVRMDPDNRAEREEAASPPEARPIRSFLARKAERTGCVFRAGIGPEGRGGVPLGAEARAELRVREVTAPG